MKCPYHLSHSARRGAWVIALKVPNGDAQPAFGDIEAAGSGRGLWGACAAHATPAGHGPVRYRFGDRA
jgi:hypothetical protein